MAITRVTQKDLDLIRIEAEDVKTHDDKYFLMEKLHKYIEALDAQVDALDYDSSVPAKEREKLLSLQRYSQEVRQFIMSRPIGPRRYGLFVEYPEGYEG